MAPVLPTFTPEPQLSPFPHVAGISKLLSLHQRLDECLQANESVCRVYKRGLGFQSPLFHQDGQKGLTNFHYQMW